MDITTIVIIGCVGYIIALFVILGAFLVDD